MRMRFEKELHGRLIRLFKGKFGAEIAYLSLRLCGPEVEIEFPSDWHEERRAWVRLGFGLGCLAFSFPWSTVVPDEGQCSGPTYGFQFFEDILWIRYGKDTGRRGDPHKTFYMPWSWKHKRTTRLSEDETHDYQYRLKSGEIQFRKATIFIEEMEWTRPWFPWRKIRRSIVVQFNGEVGERTGSWKGGTIGCGYEMNALEKVMPTYGALECLRRMEKERKF